MLGIDAALWHHYLLLSTFVLCPVILLGLLFLPAAYGRHAQGRSAIWGPGIPTRWSWVIMEMPSSVGFALIYFYGDKATDVVPLLLFMLWQAHYFHRTFVFPFRIRVKPGQTTPASIPLMSVMTNSVIAFLNAAILSWSSIRADYDLSWLSDPRFILGIVVFAAGWHINRKADALLSALRKPGESGYKIPHGWLYERVSCPNYLGEITIWCGWAIATWSWAGLAFVFLTIANLVPRALQNHRWYQQQFSNYPRHRKAIIPFVL